MNHSLWCDIADTDLPLTEGKVGLDSWWNSGAQFDNFRVDRAERVVFDWHPYRSTTLARDIVPLTSRRNAAFLGPGTVAWASDDLAGFDGDDLLLAVPETSSPAVVVAARVNLFGSQIYRFVGVMQADGRFNLLTTLIDPLSLSVAGIELVFPLDIKGRVTLQGRSAGAESWARFRSRALWRLGYTSDACRLTRQADCRQ